MKSSTDFKANTNFAALLVGEPKTGKTRVGYAFPSPGIIDIDMNLGSAIRLDKNKQFWVSQPALDEATGKEIPTADRWKATVKATKEMLVKPEVKTIWIDGLGLLTTWLMEHIVAENQKAGTNKTGKMELRDYGDVARLLRDYIMMLRLPGKYVVVTSHQTADKDELTGALRYSLAIPGQSKETLGGLFTDVWATTAQASTGGVKYNIRTKPTGFHVALGTSFDLPSAIDVTDKLPSEIWTLLQPKLT